MKNSTGRYAQEIVKRTSVQLVQLETQSVQFDICRINVPAQTSCDAIASTTANMLNSVAMQNKNARDSKQKICENDLRRFSSKRFSRCKFISSLTLDQVLDYTYLPEISSRIFQPRLFFFNLNILFVKNIISQVVGLPPFSNLRKPIVAMQYLLSPVILPTFM